AVFFWEQDLKTPLESRRQGLAEVVYQKGLGSIADRSDRVARLAVAVAGEAGGDGPVVERAASLSKCDLLTGMVGEFPELQGVMGGYYARASGEQDAVADAIAEQYRPRFAGDALPGTSAGSILAIADKLDHLAGSFVLGRKPGGGRDPFGLRRAAQGVVRIILENDLDLDLLSLLKIACEIQPGAAAAGGDPAGEIYDFIMERLRAYYSSELELPAEVFESVRVRRLSSLSDLDARVQAVASFLQLEAARALAAANKRIANILRQAGKDSYGPVNPGAFEEREEARLYEALQSRRKEVAPLLEERKYREALTVLSGLRETVDNYFDKVMVMSEEPVLRQNRLATLAELRALFLDIADISRLSIG
ncbi:MAG: glycine--tRNA ligase subunit beta, partial [Woeseia sp.]